MTPSSILVALAQAAPQASDQQLLDVDGTALVQLGVFLLTMLVLRPLLWKPYLRVREERTRRVDGFREDAKRLEGEAAARLSKVEAELAEARRTGSQERARVRQEAQKREQEILAQAQAAAQKTIVEAKAKVEAALSSERSNLKTRAEALGREAAERVLGRRVA